MLIMSTWCAFESVLQDDSKKQTLPACQQKLGSPMCSQALVHWPKVKVPEKFTLGSCSDEIIKQYLIMHKKDCIAKSDNLYPGIPA